jgi:hypothetical protein
MSATGTLETIERLARGLVRREQARAGTSAVTARARVAHRIGILPGTLETLFRKRLKRLDEWVKERIASAAIRELEREIESLSHELEIARLCRPDDHLHQVFEIEDLLQKAREALAALQAARRT